MIFLCPPMLKLPAISKINMKAQKIQPQGVLFRSNFNSINHPVHCNFLVYSYFVASLNDTN